MPSLCSPAEATLHPQGSVLSVGRVPMVLERIAPFDLGPANGRGCAAWDHPATCSHILVCVQLPVKPLQHSTSTCAVELIELIDRLPRGPSADWQRLPLRITRARHCTGSDRRRRISSRMCGYAQ